MSAQTALVNIAKSLPKCTKCAHFQLLHYFHTTRVFTWSVTLILFWLVLAYGVWNFSILNALEKGLLLHCIFNFYRLNQVIMTEC